MKPGDKVINVIREHEIFGKVNTISNIIGDHIYLEDRYECYSQNELQQVEKIQYALYLNLTTWCMYIRKQGVGSQGCLECEYNKTSDTDGGFVYCSYKYTEPNEFQKEINYLKKRIEELEGKL